MRPYISIANILIGNHQRVTSKRDRYSFPVYFLQIWQLGLEGKEGLLVLCPWLLSPLLLKGESMAAEVAMDEMVVVVTC